MLKKLRILYNHVNLKTGIEKTSDELLETDLINAPVGGKTAERTSCVPPTLYIIDTNGKHFNVKAAKDTKDCSLFGSVVLPDGQTVIIDANNSNIKLLSPDLTILHALKLPGQPIRMCLIGNSTVAVSFLRLKRINRYSINGGKISYDGGFATKLFNHGIAFDGTCNNIVAIMSDIDYSCNNDARKNSVQVEVRNVCDGDVIDVIKDFRVVNRNSWPLVLHDTQAICVATDGSVIIAELNIVLRFCLSKESTKTVAIEKNFYVCSGETTRNSIQNVTSDSDSIYVCTDIGSVLQLSISDFDTNEIILSKVGKEIRSVTVDNINNRIILGCDDCKIRVYSFK